MPIAPHPSKLTALDRFWFSPERLNLRRAGIVVFFIVAALLFFRQPAAILHPGFYGEDGKILLSSNTSWALEPP